MDVGVEAKKSHAWLGVQCVSVRFGREGRGRGADKLTLGT
jgi:hypothetical protein